MATPPPHKLATIILKHTRGENLDTDQRGRQDPPHCMYEPFPLAETLMSSIIASARPPPNGPNCLGLATAATAVAAIAARVDAAAPDDVELMAVAFTKLLVSTVEVTPFTIGHSAPSTVMAPPCTTGGERREGVATDSANGAIGRIGSVDPC